MAFKKLPSGWGQLGEALWGQVGRAGDCKLGLDGGRARAVQIMIDVLGQKTLITSAVVLRRGGNW